MNRKFRLLIVEDQPRDAELMVAELIRAGFAPEWSLVDSPEQLVLALHPAPALILCDYALPGLDALEVLNILRDLSVPVPLIVVTGQLDEETCVKSLQMGAVDYLLKDRLARLGPAVERALANRQLEIEKRAAERKEHQTASILRAVVAHSPAAISVKGVDGRYLLSNRRFESINGFPPGASIGQVDAELFPVERARRMIELDARCLHNSIVVEREEEFGDDAGVRNLLSVRYPMIDDDQEVFGIGAIYLDITRQKQIESQLRSARTEMLSRAEQLGLSNEELREQGRITADLITTVSHELRTPLTSIRGYLEMLRDQDVDLAADVAHRFLGIIDRNSEQLLGLVEDLLLLTRKGAPAYLDRNVRIADVVEAAVAVLRPAADQAGLTLAVQVDAELPAVAGDPDRLERVLANLISNAIKFSAVPRVDARAGTGSGPGSVSADTDKDTDTDTGAGKGSAGTVAVTVTGRDGGISLVVRDQGVGIGPADQALLFGRFFRAKTAREQGIPGSGLGLAVAKGIVEEHGGTIEVRSAPGRGTAVTVQLPASHPPA